MERAQRQTEELLLQKLLDNLSPEAYAEIAGLILQYGTLSKKLGEAKAKATMYARLHILLDDASEED